MKRLLDRLGSLRLTVVLLAALGVLFLAGLWIPQKRVLQRELYQAWQASSPMLVAALELAGLTDVYRSPLAITLWTLFFLNLAVVMVRRVPITRERVRIDRPVPAPGAGGTGPVRELRIRPEVTVQDVAAALRRRAFATFVDGERLRAVKNRLAPAATLAFHLSFFLLAAGGITSYVTRFEATVDLGHGEEFTSRLEQYNARPRLPRFGEPPVVPFVVETIDPRIEGNVSTGIRVGVRDPAGRLHPIEVNRPYEVGSTIVVFQDLGFAPLLIVQDDAGREQFAGFMRLNIMNGRKDRFELLGQKLEATLFPDYFHDGQEEGTRSREMRDPVLRLVMTTQSGKTVPLSLRPGDTAALGPYTLAYPEWRYWVRLFVRSERGIPVVWVGFAIATLALALRLLLYRRDLVLERLQEGDGTVLRLSGRAEYYRALFQDELERLARSLEAELGAPDGGPVARAG